VERIWLKVMGNIARLITMVKRIMAAPKLLPRPWETTIMMFIKTCTIRSQIFNPVASLFSI
jgi:hypothetical protein